MGDSDDRVAAALPAFASRLHGQLVRPQDPDYDAALKVYNGMIDRRPQLIARCVDVADVVAAVNFAATTNYRWRYAAVVTTWLVLVPATTAWSSTSGR